MVWTPPPENPILHLRNGDRTLCGRRVGRCYVARNGREPTCRTCAGLASTAKAAGPV